MEGTSAAAALAAYHARLGALDARIASAVVVDATTLPQDEVRFSAVVTLRSESGDVRRYRIVGVDEADAPSGRITFVAPLSRQLMGKRVGDWVLVTRSGAETELEIVSIEYSEDELR
jgi:transcription elongation factor GreB